MKFWSIAITMLAIVLFCLPVAVSASDDGGDSTGDVLVHVRDIDDSKVGYLSYFMDVRYVNADTGIVGGTALSSLDAVRSLPFVEDAEWAAEYHVMLNVSARSVRARNDTFEGMDSYTPETIWDLGFMGEGMIVAILDTGVDDEWQSRLDDLDDNSNTDDPKVIGYYNARTQVEENPDDDNGHGTHMAGVVMGTAGGEDDDHVRHLGVAPAARLVDIKVANSNGQTTGAYLLEALDWCIAHVDEDWDNDGPGNNGIDVILMSVGTTDTSDGSDPVSQRVNDAVNAGMIVVAAMGNGNTTIVPSPAAADLAIAVGGSDDRDTVDRTDDRLYEIDQTTGTNRGPRTDDGDDDIYDELKPDVVAPSNLVYAAMGGTMVGETPVPGVYLSSDRAILGNGTSVGAAHVAGIVTLMLQANPSLAPSEGLNPVRDILRDTAEAHGEPFNASLNWKYNTSWGFGAVDGYGAVLRSLEIDDLTFFVPDDVESDFDTPIVSRSAVNSTGYTANETLNLTFSIPKGWAEVNSVTFRFDGDTVLADWGSDETYGIAITGTPNETGAWTISAWVNLTAEKREHWTNITLMARAPMVGSEEGETDFNITFNRTINGNYSAERSALITVTTEWGTVSGVVGDKADGTAIEGVRVRLAEEHTSTVKYETSTDTDGNYVLANLTEGYYDMKFWKQGYLEDDNLTRVQVIAGVNATGNDVELTREGGNGYISGVVTGGNGTLLNGALVEAYDGGDLTASDTTNADGEYELELPAGTYVVVASKDGYHDSSEEDVDVETGTTTTLDLEMTRAPDDGRIHGTVKDDDGSPISDATIKAFLDGDLEGQTKTASNGSYNLSLQAGTYSVRSIRTGYVTAEKTGISLSEGGTRKVDLTMTHEEDMGWIFGTVLEFSSGDPVKVKDVLVVAERGKTSGSDTTDASGYFRIDIGAGTYDIVATKTGYMLNNAFTNVQVNEGEGMEIFIEMVTINSAPEVIDVSVGPSTTPPDGRSLILITAVIEDDNGLDDIASVTVDLSMIGGSGSQLLYDSGSRGDETAGDGTYSFETVTMAGTPEGNYVLTVTVTDSVGDTDTGSTPLTVKEEKDDGDDDDDGWLPGFEAFTVLGALMVVFTLAGRKRFK